jgi:hypothetical protein
MVLTLNLLFISHIFKIPFAQRILPKIESSTDDQLVLFVYFTPYNLVSGSLQF